MYYIRCKDGCRWKVRQAVSLTWALDTIASAMAGGAIEAKTFRDTTWFGGAKICLADVVKVNSDNTERQPYTKG